MLNKDKRRRLEFFSHKCTSKNGMRVISLRQTDARRQHDISYTLWPILQLHGLRTVIRSRI